jgi:hypothetical protein
MILRHTTMHENGGRNEVARASRPLSRGRLAPAGSRGQDARATAGETPTLRRLVRQRHTNLAVCCKTDTPGL